MFDSLVDKIRTSKPYLEDKWQIRLSLLVRCIKIRFLLSKWRKCMNIHWAKTKFKIEWESSYPVKHILGDPFFVFMCSLHLVFYPKFPGFWTLISRFLVFWGWEVCSQLWDHADMDTSLASSKSLYLNPKSNIRIGYIYKSTSILPSVSFNLQSFTENRFWSQLWFITEVKNYICRAGGENPELRQLLEYISQASLHPPRFRGLTAPRSSHSPAFPESAAYFKIFWNPWWRFIRWIALASLWTTEATKVLARIMFPFF